MTLEAAGKLTPGLYRLTWIVGGSALAAVGVLRDGRRWYAHASALSVSAIGIASTNWRIVKRAELVEAQQP